LKAAFGDRVQFLAVYVREAHPTDGWRMTSNDRAGVVFAQPKTLTERIGVADKCCQALGITMPLLVDSIDDRIGHAYSGMPDRLYIVDQQGRVAYKGGRGPFGFKPGEMAQSLAMLLLDEAGEKTDAEKQATQGARFPILDDDAAWERLPAVEATSSRSLPLWARSVAASLPQTAAVMLEQDYAYRTSEAFDPKLRARMRWVAANANRCAYSQAYAEADLRRLGADESEIRALHEETTDSPKERAALAFARKMTLAAYSVSDEEVEQLIEHFGEKTYVAMVLQMAFANFQDRLLLALNVPVEPEGPLAPLDVRFVPRKLTEIEAAARSGDVEPAPDEIDSLVEDVEWKSLTFDQLQLRLDQQRARNGRVRVPEWSEVHPQLPPEIFPPDKPSRVQWSLCVLGYQPQLGVPWLKGLRTFGREANQDRVFEESLFWVVTKSLDCFY
jgi:hypothetical protein